MGELSEAAKSNDRRKTLVALRDKLSQAIDDCASGRDIAALSKRLMEVIGEIDSIPDPESDAKSPAHRAREMVRRRAAERD